MSVTCGHFLRNGTEENKNFVQYTMDLLSIPNFWIKKGRPHGHRYGKKPGDHEYYITNSLKKKCKKKFYLGIHDRFIRDEKFRKNMFDTGRTEEMCRKMDELANEESHAPPDSRRNSRIQSQLVDSFKQSWSRYDASPASIWLQASIVNLATAQRPRGCSSSAKMDANLFLVLVELARILVAFFLWASPRRRTQHRLIRETW